MNDVEPDLATLEASYYGEIPDGGPVRVVDLSDVAIAELNRISAELAKVAVMNAPPTSPVPAESLTVEFLQATIDALRAENEALRAEVRLLRPAAVAGLSRGAVLARAFDARSTAGLALP